MLSAPHEDAQDRFRRLATTPVLSAILVGPPRDWFKAPGAPLRRITLLQEVRRSLKTQQHAHSSTDPSVEKCVQVRRRRSNASLGEHLERRFQN
jgi:hypothetical protein